MGRVDEAEFWRVIDLVNRRWIAEDEYEAVAPLIDILASETPAEIVAFQEHLAQKLHALDGRRYMEHAGESRGSTDGFLYARCYVVARGEREFRRVLGDPALMPKSLDEWCEALLYVARTAYERATGTPAHLHSSVSYETGSNRAQWE